MSSTNIIVSKDPGGDYSDIQTAINNLPTDGGCIHIHPGIYEISSSNLIRINKPNVSLTGYGAASVIRLAHNVSFGNSPKDIITIENCQNPMDNIVISNLRIDGNRTNNEYSFGIKVENDCKNITIENCIFDNCYSGGINTGTIDGANPCEYLIITNNTIRNSKYHGIALFGTNYATVNCNSVIGNDNDGETIGHGIYIYGGANCTVFGNTANNFVQGISLQKCNGISVNGNNVVNNQNSGIMAQQGGNNAITGNILYSNNTKNTEHDNNEIQLRSYQGLAEEHDLISGNVFFNQNPDMKFAVTEHKHSDSEPSPNNNVIIANNYQLTTNAGTVKTIGSGSLEKFNKGN